MRAGIKVADAYKACVICGSKENLKPCPVGYGGSTCEECEGKLVRQIFIECPVCQSPQVATLDGFFSSMNLDCGHTMTPFAGQGWITVERPKKEPSIKSKVEDSEILP